ncbi:MAG: F0F1 ATP synthase subunit B [Candidatus Saccharimonadales bacterium]
MMDLLTQFGTSSGGIGALGINWHDFIIQLLTFLISLLVLRQFAFKPILKVLKRRRKLIESGVSLGQKMQKEQAELEAQVEQTLQAARAEADGIIATAQDAARMAIGEAENQAKVKAEAIANEAKDRIAQDAKRMRKQLEKELVGLVSGATEAIIDEKVDAKKDAALIDRALKVKP